MKYTFKEKFKHMKYIPIWTLSICKRTFYFSIISIIAEIISSARVEEMCELTN